MNGLAGKILDADYRITAKGLGRPISRITGDDIATFPIERSRIRSVWYFVGLGIASTIGFGWAVALHAHLSVPLVMAFLCGISNTGVFNVSKISHIYH